jgi:hypothetical protein
MRKLYTLLLVMIGSVYGWGQTAITPSFSPAIFSPEDEITITYDVTGTSLANLSSAYAWVWIPGQNIDAKYNVNPASSDPTKTNNAKFVKTVADGKTLFSITFVPADFFSSSIATQTTMGLLL